MRRDQPRPPAEPGLIRGEDAQQRLRAGVAQSTAEGAVMTATWGSIVGTLSDQLDLIAALDVKLDDSQATAYGLSLLAAANATAAKSLLMLAKADVGLSNVDNTSDLSKPVSTAQQAAIDLKLDATAYTAADVIAKLLTVDGAGSGLDADTLDAQSGDYYLARSNHTGDHTTIPTADGATISCNGVDWLELTQTFPGKVTVQFKNCFIPATYGMNLGSFYWTGDMGVRNNDGSVLLIDDERATLVDLNTLGEGVIGGACLYMQQTGAVPTAVDQVVAQLHINGKWNVSGGDNPAPGYLAFVSAGAWSDGSCPMDAVIGVAGSGSETPVERFRVRAAGAKVTGDLEVTGTATIDDLLMGDGATKVYGYSNASFSGFTNGPAASGEGIIFHAPNDRVLLYADGAPRVQVTVNGIAAYTNDTYSSGTDPLRWSNIYSVLGNFSSTVTIGGNLTVSANATLGDTTADAQTLNGNVTLNVTGASAHNLKIINVSQLAQFRLGFSGGSTYLSAYDNTGASWAPWIIGGSQINFQISAVNVLIARSTGTETIGEHRCDTLRIDVAPTAATPTPTHTIPINCNGTVYRVPCVI